MPDRWGMPLEDDIVINAAAEVSAVDGSLLHELWPSVVRATHPETGNTRLEVNQSIFLPPDFDRFVVVRTRAVSAFEKYGPNINGDAFPADELQKAAHTWIAKGFYIEHQSHDPRNAVGIIAYSNWLPEEQFIEQIAFIDKERFPREARMIRDTLHAKTAGVSIGCIAGTAQCSYCGNVAKKKHEICAHMDRNNSMCIKGRKKTSGEFMAYDLCKHLVGYELSQTRAPADRDAMSNMVMGTTVRLGEKEETKGAPVEMAPADTSTPTPLTEEGLSKMVQTIVNAVIRSRMHKLIKGEIEKQLGERLRDLQVEMKPAIKELVSEKKGMLPK